MSITLEDFQDVKYQLMCMRQRAEILTGLVEHCSGQFDSLVAKGMISEAFVSLAGFDHVLFQAYEVKIGLSELEDAVEVLEI
jgi:hypothetical protein